MRQDIPQKNSLLKGLVQDFAISLSISFLIKLRSIWILILSTGFNMSQKMELHTFRVKVDILKVFILVKFPCKLSFQLKADSTQTESSKEYELKKGECTPNEQLSIEVSLLFNPSLGKYENKKIRLMVMMTSQNGFIFAGTASVDPLQQKVSTEHTLLLQKCPDSNARIVFAQTSTLLNRKMVNNQAKLSKTSVGSKLVSQSSKYLMDNHDISRGQEMEHMLEDYPSKQRRNYDSDFLILQTSKEKLMGSLNLGEGGQYTRSKKQLIHEDKSEHSLFGPRGTPKMQRPQIDIKELKVRIRESERSEHERQMELTDLKEQLKKCKQQCMQGELLRNQLEGLLAEKDARLKQCKTDKKKQEDILQDLTLTVTTLQKRIEYKDNLHQQQITKLTQKYSQSETDRQRVTVDANNILIKLEESEKKHQLASREKEKAYLEEKSKTTKQINSLLTETEQLKEKLNDSSNALKESLATAKSLAKKELQLEQIITRLNSEVELTSKQLVYEQEERKTLEKEIERLKIVEDERNTLKKQKKETQFELTKSLQKGEKLEFDITKSTAKAKELQKMLSTVNSEHQVLVQKHSGVVRELESFRAAKERTQNQSEQLSVQNYNVAQKNAELKNKLQQSKREYEESRYKYEQKIAYLNKSKDHLEAQTQELKWSLQQSQEKAEQYQTRLREGQEDIFRLTSDLLRAEEQIKRINQEQTESKQIITLLKTTLSDYEVKNKQLRMDLQDKNSQLFETSQKCLHYQKESTHWLEGSKHLQASQAAKEQEYSREIEEKQSKIKNLKEQLDQAKIAVSQKHKETEQLREQLSASVRQGYNLKQNLSTTKEQLNIKDKKVEELIGLSKHLQDELANFQRDNSKLQKKLNDETQCILQLRTDWTNYRVETSKALEHLFQEISKDESTETGKFSLLPFPDLNISTLQIEIMKKHHASAAQQKEKMTLLQQMTATQTEELSKAKRKMLEKQNQWETSLKREKDSAKKRTDSLSEQRDQLILELQQATELIASLKSECQKLKSTLKRRDDTIKEIETQCKQVSKELELRTLELKTSQQAISVLKEREAQNLTSSQALLQAINNENALIIEQLKSGLHSFEIRQAASNRSLRDQQEALRKLKEQHLKAAEERDRIAKGAAETQEKYLMVSNELKNAQSSLKQSDRDSKDNAAVIAQLSEQVEAGNKRQQQLFQLLTRTRENVANAELANSKLTLERQAAEQKRKKVEEGAWAKEGKLKQEVDRLFAELKKTNDQVMGLRSDLQLKVFLIDQQAQQLSVSRASLVQLREVLQQKKSNIIELGDSLQEYKANELVLKQNIENMKAEKRDLMEQFECNRLKSIAVEEELMSLANEARSESNKDQIITQLRKDLSNLQLTHDKFAAELIKHVKLPRNQMSLGRSVKDLAEGFSSGDILSEFRRYLIETEQVKNIAHEKSQVLAQQISNLQNEFDFQRTQYLKEIESLETECQEYSRLVAQRDAEAVRQVELVRRLTLSNEARDIRTGGAGLDGKQSASILESFQE